MFAKNANCSGRPCCWVGVPPRRLLWTGGGGLALLAPERGANEHLLPKLRFRVTL